MHEFVAARRRTRTSGATIRRDLVMGRIMRVARRAGWITANPVPDEMEEIKERREPIRPVVLCDLARLTRRAPPGMRDMIRFLARTGCRQEEAASLSWEQLDLKAPCPTVTFAITKTRSPRVVRLSPRLAREL
ncbi:tyrosine-type recombinase/integrase [Asaia prunellae]|uniref:tyrosine-type recombinase/integrase n=1 Tax=Asaia prunellae TaxID=610245 RepID=UPI00131EF01A